MTETTPDRARRPFRMALPLMVFAAIVGFFLLALFGGDPSKLPSALIGKPVPQFELPGLEGLRSDGKPVPGLSSAALASGKVAIVNFWASWCAPCRAEHPLLMQLADTSGAAMYGINYKDGTSAARRFLGQLGNPFAAMGVDSSGRTSLDWGVYGLPETFIVDGKGIIVHKHVGPLSEKTVRDELLPAIERARRSETVR